MFAKFFIERPVLANVIAIITVVLGVVCLLELPVAQYPNIIPPEILIQALKLVAYASTPMWLAGIFGIIPTLAIIGGVGFTLQLGWAFYAGLAAAAGIMGVHYTWIRGRERMSCFKAFLHNNWVGAAIFAGIVIDFLVSGRSFG